MDDTITRSATRYGVDHALVQELRRTRNTIRHMLAGASKTPKKKPGGKKRKLKL
jgi:hypothetical protein